MTSHGENLPRNLAIFQLKIDPVAPDGDCLFIGLADSMEGNILQLR